jgi:hypothetical protein
MISKRMSRALLSRNFSNSSVVVGRVIGAPSGLATNLRTHRASEVDHPISVEPDEKGKKTSSYEERAGVCYFTHHERS